MPEVEFGCQVVTYGDVQGAVRGAVRAEHAGFDLVSLPDHLFHPTDGEEFLVEPPWGVFTTLGAVAERTEEVDLMPGVADTVRRHPTELAHATATLDRLSDGRARLGLGAGEAFNLAPVNDFDWSKPFSRFREACEVVTDLWASTAEEPCSVSGEFYDLDAAHMRLKPVRNPPPLWVGGYGPKMRAFTGRVADGWYPWVYTPEAYERDLAGVREAAAEAGRDPDDLACALLLPTAVDEDGDAARRRALERNRTTLALRPPLLRDLGYEDLAAEATYMRDATFDEAQREKLLAVADRVPAEAVEAVSAVGTPAEVIDSLETFVEAGVDRLVVIPTGDFESVLEHYEETIIPHFRE